MSDQPSVYEFGPFRLDRRHTVLWRGGEVVPIPPKALDLLIALVDEHGDVVSKEELLRRVWPDTFVEEANLSVNVSILRKALGDQPGDRPWIDTVARRGYRFAGPVTARSAPPRTLAVLPFRPLVSSEADDSLGLGMADALITHLSAIGKITVRPTSAVRRFVAPDVDPLEAGRVLRVDAILDARMQREGSQLRVTVQLLPVDGSAPLWADRFEEEFKQLFAMQDAIAERLAAALLTELGATRKPLGRRSTENLEAYQAYCRGRFFWGRFTRSWIEKAVRCFHQAAALDPRFALPHAGLADAYLIAGFSGVASPRKAWGLAASETTRARQLDDRLAETSVASAFLRLFESWDWKAAEQELCRALDLGPHLVAAHQWNAFFLALRGRYAESSRALANAEELDPLSLAISALRGFLCSLTGDQEGELAQQKRTAELDPNHFLGQWALGIAWQNSGRPNQAVACLERALALAEDAAFLKPVLARSLALAGETRAARGHLAELKKRKAGWVSLYQRATVHLALGEPDQALDSLSRACQKRDPWVVLLGVDPMLAPLRGHPAFEELVRRVCGS